MMMMMIDLYSAIMSKFRGAVIWGNQVYTLLICIA